MRSSLPSSPSIVSAVANASPSPPPSFPETASSPPPARTVTLSAVSTPVTSGVPPSSRLIPVVPSPIASAVACPSDDERVRAAAERELDRDRVLVRERDAPGLIDRDALVPIGAVDVDRRHGRRVEAPAARIGRRHVDGARIVGPAQRERHGLAAREVDRHDDVARTRCGGRGNGAQADEEGSEDQHGERRSDPAGRAVTPSDDPAAGTRSSVTRAIVRHPPALGRSERNERKRPPVTGGRSVVETRRCRSYSQPEIESLPARRCNGRYPSRP